MSIKLKLRGFASRKDGFFILLAVAILAVIIGLQQLIPSGKPIPFARIDGDLVRISSTKDITERYKVTEERELSIVIQDYSGKYKLRDLGISLDEQPTIEPYIVESRLHRLIPFSSLAQIFRDNQPSYTSSKKSLFIVTTAIADQINRPAKNAEIVTDTPFPQIKASVDGVLFEPEKATFAIFKAIEDNRSEVTLSSETATPDVTTAELEQATAIFTSSLPEEITIKIGGQASALPKSTMYSWLSYTVQDGKPVVDFDAGKLKSYAEELTRVFASSELPTATIVNLVDGKETGRISGRSGKSIVSEDLMKAISGAIKNKELVINASLVDVPSPVKYTRSYTKSSAGLQDLLNQITDGKEISIRYIDINERGWDVGSRQNARSRMASTYKMFVLYSVLKRIEAGTMSFSEQVNGRTMDSCLQTIIIDSNNECAIAIAERIGWTTIANEGKALGATGLDWSEELWGTVSDAAVIPTKLARGEILTESSRNYMLDLMKRQRFRNGIPAGTPHIVADKVGFIDGWLNDAAIVYAPDQTYVLAIYTSSQSWATIAEITRQIETLAL
jgi:beta-lactamase class A